MEAFSCEWISPMALHSSRFPLIHLLQAWGRPSKSSSSHLVYWPQPWRSRLVLWYVIPAFFLSSRPGAVSQLFNKKAKTNSSFVAQGGRHCFGALFTIALAIQLFLSSKDPYQIPKGSHHAILQKPSRLDDKSTNTLQEPEVLVSTFNTSLDVVDSPYAVLLSQSTYTRRQISVGQAYKKALCNGKQLLSKVNENIHYRISRFSVYEELEENGWTPKQINHALPTDLKKALSDLRISAIEQDNVYVTLDHDREFPNQHGQRVVSYRRANRLLLVKRSSNLKT